MRYLLLVICLGASALSADEGQAELRLHARQRAKVEGQEAFKVSNPVLNWDAKQTAVVVCDMWDKHWCENSTRRVGEMVPHMNEVLKIARNRGALIIHCPSETMDFYKDHA